MDEVLQANIFFFVTSVAVIVFTLLLCLALFYIIKILQSVRRIINRIDTESEMIVEDVKQLRSYVLGGGFVSQLVSFFTRRRRGKTTREKQGTHVDVTDEN